MKLLWASPPRSSYLPWRRGRRATPRPPHRRHARTRISDNQLTGFGSAALGYDANGNMTKDDQGDTLVWDGWNHLLSVTNSSGTMIASYTYDGAGRLITQTNGTTRTDIYYSGTQDIETRTGVTTTSTGTVAADNVFSPIYTNALLTRTQGGTRLYFTSDANQDITGVYSSAGTALQHQVYDAYGKVTYTNGSWSSISSDGYSLTHLWQGGYRDAATGLYLFQHRWYSVDVQWLSEDPWGYVDGASLYPAMAANPINRLDPWGLQSTATATAPNPNVVVSEMSNRYGKFNWTLEPLQVGPGMHFNITFKPTEGACKAKDISFIQVILKYQSDATDPNANHYENAYKTPAGSYVDRFENEPDPFYGAKLSQDNRWVTDGNGHVGTDNGKEPYPSADDRPAAAQLKAEFITLAVSIQQRVVYGGVIWGFTINTKGVTYDVATDKMIADRTYDPYVRWAKPEDPEWKEWNNAVDAWNIYAAKQKGHIQWPSPN